MSKLQPIVKWSGSKRSQAEEIIKHFPKEIETYYEPFCGGCSVLWALLKNLHGRKVKYFVCSDVNRDLIDLWNAIKFRPMELLESYSELWHELNKDNDLTRKSEYYNSVRERYNKERSPLDFFFLLRTCYNGMPRYNKKGEFNTSFHLNRNGIEPKRLEPILKEWTLSLAVSDVYFTCCSYKNIIPKSSNDFVYLDPPYANTKGMYFSDNFNNEEMFQWMKELPCPYALSYDGVSGKDDKTFDVPQDLYDEHLYIKSGNSSFKRIKESDKNAVVFESLYVRN